jgi:hypothetical protein
LRGAYLVELPTAVMAPGSAQSGQWFKLLQSEGVQQRGSGIVTKEAQMKIITSPTAQQRNSPTLDVPVQDLRAAWRGTLDW